VPCCGKGIRYEIRETRDGNIMPLPRDRSTGIGKKCVCNLGGRRTQSVSEEEFPGFRGGRALLGSSTRTGGRLPTTAEAAFGIPIIPAAMISAESTVSSGGALKQWQGDSSMVCL
jgi:hypothetical protein